MSLAFVFPGQGSQAVGMGAELAKAHASARAVFDEVDAALGQKLSQIMFEGPLETLTLTENAQPALMAVSLAVMRVLETEKGFHLAGKVKYVAGHSLGEYSALAAAGAISVADAARLLKTRGRAMQAAVPVGHGADDNVELRRWGTPPKFDFIPEELAKPELPNAYYSLGCGNKVCTGSPLSFGDTKVLAIDAWNTRYVPEVQS